MFALALAFAVLAIAAPTPAGPLPDLDELPPAAVSVVPRNGHSLLVFASAAADDGPGALVVEGHRVKGVMQAWQVVGHKRIALGVALQYVSSETHRHWHLLGFERYELRQLGGTVVGHD